MSDIPRDVRCWHVHREQCNLEALLQCKSSISDMLLMWDSSLRQLEESQEITCGRLVGVTLPVEWTDFVAVEPLLAAATLISGPSRILALQQCAS